MTKSILKLSLAGLLAAAVIGMPVQLRAQTTNAPEKKAKHSETGAKRSTIPFHGKLKAVDHTAKTISVGETTIQVTSETKITKAGKPATLADGVVGEDVSGAYKKSEEGKVTALSVRFGPKPEKSEAGEKKEEKK
jgi:hypothetical protein